MLEHRKIAKYIKDFHFGLRSTIFVVNMKIHSRDFFFIFIGHICHPPLWRVKLQLSIPLHPVDMENCPVLQDSILLTASYVFHQMENSSITTFTEMFYFWGLVKSNLTTAVLMKYLSYSTRTLKTVTNAQRCILLAKQHLYKLTSKISSKGP